MVGARVVGAVVVGAKVVGGVRVVGVSVVGAEVVPPNKGTNHIFCGSTIRRGLRGVPN